MSTARAVQAVQVVTNQVSLATSTFLLEVVGQIHSIDRAGTRQT